MILSKSCLAEKRAALLCPAGEHIATLFDIECFSRPTGDWLRLDYTVGDCIVSELFLLNPHQQRLAGLSLDHLERLLAAVQATLGVEEVPDLLDALDHMKGVAVEITVEHSPDPKTGTDRAGITTWARIDDPFG